jgi:hypothetical protein
LNKLIPDSCTNPSNTTPLLRTVNLVQYGFGIDVYNFSNNAKMFDNVNYGEVTEYLSFPTGDYVVYWMSASWGNKRSIHGNTTSDPILFPGRTYTYWVFPDVSFIIDDCFPPPSRKRAVEETAGESEIDKNKDSNDKDTKSISSFRMKRAVKRQAVKMDQGEEVK